MTIHSSRTVKVVVTVAECKMKKALVAMSGGVDSSIAAKLMKDRNFECIGCTMKLYHNEDAGVEQSRTS